MTLREMEKIDTACMDLAAVLKLVQEMIDMLNAQSFFEAFQNERYAPATFSPEVYRILDKVMKYLPDYEVDFNVKETAKNGDYFDFFLRRKDI